MRLTLRTLLAYLDDILSPADTKEIGEKIAATPSAAALAERIRTVMRRRRLKAPEPDGSGGGLDPNFVATYLDNTMPPERVHDIERILLESDVNLAEAAASHQILTLVLGEPVHLNNKLRERMYALGPEGASLEAMDPPPPSAKVRESNAREQMNAMRTAGEPVRTVAAPAEQRSLESRLPDYLRKPPLWKRVAPWAAALLVIAIWLGFLYGNRDNLFGLRKPQEVAQADGQPAQVPAKLGQGEQQRKSEEANQQGGPKAVQPPDAETGEGDTANAAPIEEPSVNPPPPAGAIDLIPGQGAAPGSGAQATAGGDDANALPAEGGMTSNPAPVEAAAPGGDSEPTENGGFPTIPAGNPAAQGGNVAGAIAAPEHAQFVFSSRRGVILAQRSDAGLWYPIPNGENPLADQAIAVPAPFEAEGEITGLPLSIDILSGTRITPLAGTPAAPLGLDLEIGRIRIAASDPDTVGVESMRFSLRLGDAMWRIEMLAPTTLIGIEAQPIRPSEPGEDLTAKTPQAIVYVPQGTIRLTDGAGHVQKIAAGGRAVLSPAETNGKTTFPPPEQPAPGQKTVANAGGSADKNENSPSSPAEAPAANSSDQGLPAEVTLPAGGGVAEKPAALPIGFPGWLAPQEPTQAGRRAAQAFAMVFLAGRPVDESLLPEIENPRYFIAQPAAATLALVENVDGMLKTLRDAKLQEVRQAAFMGLRNWLGRSPDHGTVLRKQLQTIFARDDLVNILERLLWGFDREDARDLATSRQLVSWLTHPDPLIRELAFRYVEHLSGRSFDYRPSLAPTRRSNSVQRWMELIERQGGLVAGGENDSPPEPGIADQKTE